MVCREQTHHLGILSVSYQQNISGHSPLTLPISALNDTQRFSLIKAIQFRFMYVKQQMKLWVGLFGTTFTSGRKCPPSKWRETGYIERPQRRRRKDSYPRWPLGALSAGYRFWMPKVYRETICVSCEKLLHGYCFGIVLCVDWRWWKSSYDDVIIIDKGDDDCDDCGDKGRAWLLDVVSRDPAGFRTSLRSMLI